MEATGKYRTRGFIGESNTRVIFGEFVCKKQLADFLLAILATTSFFLSFFVLSNGFVGVSM